MKVLIVGGGNTLYFLCRSLLAKDHEIVIINRDPSECIQLARDLAAATVVCGDGSTMKILEEAGAMEADAVLAVTPNDQDNLVICQLASLQFDVPKAVALANDPDNAEAFRRLGVSAFSTTNIVSSLIEQWASLEHILNLIPVGEGRVNVTEIILEEDAPVAGKYLKEIELPENALIAVLIRHNRPTIPRGENDLQAGDRLVVITMPENHRPVMKALTGKPD
ncbi:potassium channel family protein [Desulfatiglans anilini]|uniref:potassium channel family protein n=1 Tax=Desulfatiglans anilini TaxID=90728 RepID=UPI0004294BF9|nr:TrkA family potassium uptake protein [Desulfatiglans anilini]